MIMYTEIQHKFTDLERHSLQNKSLDQQRKKTQQGRYYFLLNKNEKNYYNRHKWINFKI
jgi:hypothetical protein